jgi:preprotein translocase subunit SecA
MLSKKLKKVGIKHTVLNAKKHEGEAEIVAQAGRKGAITISTNMAGRGTDILLGGNPEQMALAQCGHDKDHEDFEAIHARFESECARERKEVLEAGGLHILGTERHESRRIDNQLRGRAGRQGDPGSSQFFLSLEDDLLRIFEADRVAQWWDRVGVEEGEAIENRMLSRVIEGAQKKVEGRNFDIRKHLLDYDNVMNKQRQAFYARRFAAMSSDEAAVREEVEACVEGFVANLVERSWPQRGDPEDDEYVEMAHALEAEFGPAFSIEEPPFRDEEGKRPGDKDELGHAILERLTQVLDEKKEEGRLLREETYAEIDSYPTFDKIVRDIQLQILDQQWKAHLHTMDALRESINLRGYAQRDPKIEYQREGFELFGDMEQRIDDSFAEYVFKFGYPRPNLQASATARRVDGGNPAAGRAASSAGAAAGAGSAGSSAGGTAGTKVGRNDPCPCGSGKKYKKCCGA